MFTGAAFAAHKGAGNAAGGVQLFFKFHAQGEEIHPFTRLFAHGNIAQHAGFAIADHCAAIGKAAELAGFHHKRAAGKKLFQTCGSWGKVALRDANSSAIVILLLI